MSDFPVSQEYNPVVITPVSACSTGSAILSCLSSNNAIVTNAWPGANHAYYIPFFVYSPITVYAISMENGATIANNFDVGIYDDQQNRLVSKGSTAHATANVTQTFDITDTLLFPGMYYMAMSSDSTTATVRSWLPSGGAVHLRTFGVLAQTLGSVTLPDPAVFAANTDGFMPYMALHSRTTI